MTYYRNPILSGRRNGMSKSLADQILRPKYDHPTYRSCDSLLNSLLRRPDHLHPAPFTLGNVSYYTPEELCGIYP